MPLNKEYSYKDFTHKTFTETRPEEWNDTEVVGTCFYNLKPKSEIFPEGIRGVKFIRCNLDNIVIPKDCTVEGGCNRLIQEQKDGEDWLLDDNLMPVEPLNKGVYVKLGLSISPAALPTTAKAVSVVQEKRQQLEDALEAQKAALDAAATWRK